MRQRESGSQLAKIACCTFFGVFATQLVAMETAAANPLRFVDITDLSGITTTDTWKYGGPSLADFDGDGDYDVIVNHHDQAPAQLFWSNGDGTFTEHSTPIARWDVHGFAPGDYDQDGDVDLIYALGGGNGTSPRPPRLLQNDDEDFQDVTEGAGLAGLGARGRSPRWIDMDLDGDLDLLQINAAQASGESGPRNLVHENLGDGTFAHHPSSGIEQIEAERVLVTDFNNDGVLDLVTFPPLGFWQGNGDLSFTEKTWDMLPNGFDQRGNVMAAAHLDYDNDGDFDYYVARGKTYYEIANNSISMNLAEQRLDIRDEGNASRDGLEFTATQDVTLSRFFHWPRGRSVTLPVYLGANKIPLSPPPALPRAISRDEAQGWPEKRDESGWYLGHTSDGNWRLEWYLEDDLAWDIRASVGGVQTVEPKFKPEALRYMPDVLLRNDGGKLTNVTSILPEEHVDNNWGVTHGDFNNDGFEDLFVYRFGELNERIPDLMLINQSGESFAFVGDVGATNIGSEAHGDMGVAVDVNLDGRLDILSGDDQDGRWRLFANATPETSIGAPLFVNVGYSPSGLDPHGARVELQMKDGSTQSRMVGSAGAVHSQSLMNIVHFGVGDATDGITAIVTWRDGTKQMASELTPHTLLRFGRSPATFTPPHGD